MSSKGGSIFDRGAVGVVVGKWSCVLDGETWRKVSDGEREVSVEQFGQTQSRRWREGSEGAFSWTSKMEWMDGGEWDSGR